MTKPFQQVYTFYGSGLSPENKSLFSFTGI